MASEARERDDANRISRRVLLKTAGVAAGVVALAPRIARAQTPAPMAPPSTITTPPRDFGPNAPPNVYFTDPDVLTIDPLFNGLRQPNAPVQRLWTGALWSEGPAWSAQAVPAERILNNRQMVARGQRPGRQLARRRTTATAIRSTSRAASCPANI
jgi:gluconolactonase